METVISLLDSYLYSFLIHMSNMWIHVEIFVYSFIYSSIHVFGLFVGFFLLEIKVSMYEYF